MAVDPKPTSVRFDIATIDAADAGLLSTFWCGLLGLGEIENEDGGRWRCLGVIDAATGIATRVLGVQRIEGLVPPDPGSVPVDGPSKPSMHLDLECEVDRFDTEVARIIRLGGVLRRRVRNEPYGWVANFADPEGHLFDLCAYHR